MDNKEIIGKFYTSFSNGNFEGMLECYHKDVVFEDAVFGRLEGESAFKMWEMLLSQKKGDTKISFNNIELMLKPEKQIGLQNIFMERKKEKL